LFAKLSAQEAMHFVSQNLQHLTEKQHLRPSELARGTGLPETTVKYILGGNTANPRIETVCTLADFFGVSLDHFVKDALASETTPPPSMAHTTMLPLLKWEEAPDWVENQPSAEVLSWIPAEEGWPEKSFAVRVLMPTIPQFPEKSLLLIAPQQTYHDGDYIFVSIDGSKPVLRKIFEEADGLYLFSLRDIPGPEKMSEKHTILGKICECRQFFA
tara:strand:- start:1457 stop:2101 length:645 start_codon:yes stop_codon:yes gene_type:complete